MKNNCLSKVSTSAAKFAIKKNSPEILLGAGIVGFVGTIFDKDDKNEKEEVENEK